MRTPGGATTKRGREGDIVIAACVCVCCHLPLHCNDEIVARTHHNILRILVAKIEDINIVDLDDSIARLQASLLRQTASVDLQSGKGNGNEVTMCARARD